MLALVPPKVHNTLLRAEEEESTPQFRYLHLRSVRPNGPVAQTDLELRVFLTLPLQC